MLTVRNPSTWPDQIAKLVKDVCPGLVQMLIYAASMDTHHQRLMSLRRLPPRDLVEYVHRWKYTDDNHLPVYEPTVRNTSNRASCINISA